MKPRVFVLDTNKTPLMPCKEGHAYELINSGRAAIWSHQPFTIILKYAIQNPVYQPLAIYVDPGSKETGVAIVVNAQPPTPGTTQSVTVRRVIYFAQIHHRGDRIHLNMIKRKGFRQHRRSLLRYRPARWQNRCRSPKWMPPSLESRISNITTTLRRFIKIAPISSLHMEYARFDIQKMRKPEIRGIGYQKGSLFEKTVGQYVRAKFNYTCAYCGTKQGPFEKEHVFPRSKGGTDTVDNLVLACVPCNAAKGNILVEDFLKNRPKKLAWIKKQLKKSYKHAGIMNRMQKRLFEEIQKLNLPTEMYFGVDTHWNREKQQYPKDHHIDAACGGQAGNLVQLDPNMHCFMIKALGHGTRKMMTSNSSGTATSKSKSRIKRRGGFACGDIVVARVKRGNFPGTHTSHIIGTGKNRCDVYVDGKNRFGTTRKNLKLL